MFILRRYRQILFNGCLNDRYLPSRRYTNRNILTLHERGLLQDFFPDSSNELQALLSKVQCIYAGFDPTADSLHIGNLLVLMTLLHGQRGGHEVIAVVGGATASVGDPSGHTSERSQLEPCVVEKNVSGICSCLQQIFWNHKMYFWKDLTGNNPLMPLRILNNIDWYRKQNIIDFMSGVGRNFRLADMLSKQSVVARLASLEGMNFSEFSYQVFQAYDWLYLFDKYQCRLQVGGRDQMGNIYAGHDLINKTRGEQVYGMLGPLLTSESGYKVGKSGGCPVWLAADKTTPFEMYQYFIRITDSDVWKYLKLFTFLSLPEIDQLEAEHVKSPHLRKAQKKLAQSVVLLVHGEDGLKLALNATDVLYNTSPGSLALLSEEELHQTFKQASSAHIILHPEDACRIINAGGLHVNYHKVINADDLLMNGEHILPNSCSVIRVGKKNYYIVKWLK